MNSNLLTGIIFTLIASVSFYFNYQSQIYIEKQTKEIQGYKSEIKALNERLMTLQETEDKKKALEVLVKEQEVKITQQAQDIESLRSLIIETSKNKKHHKIN
jgi:seryl-tRNA(Sec) selenium transferase